jgi:hypothetical protein
MDPTAPFRLRRVLLGVLVGLTLLALAFFGWVQYRRGQYHDREKAVIGGYHREYVLCVSAGNAATGCAERVLAACQLDPFWRVAKPFAADPRTALPDPGERCASGAAG